MTLREIWTRVVKTEYTRGLEAEIARLRAENRALLNSILGIAGIPPIVTQPADLSAEAAGGERAEESAGAAAALNRSIVSSHRRPGRAPGRQRAAAEALPIRHRSWQQVNRILEIAAMRKREQEPVAVRTDDRG